jgi:hypothetical protein
MVSVVGLAFSMSELWGNTSEPRLFAQHVRGVSRFLDNLLRQAEPPPEVTSGGIQDAQSAQQQAQQQQQQAQQQAGQNGMGSGLAAGRQATDQPPVVWQRPRGRRFGTDEFLTFELAESPGIFAWPEAPLPFVVCALRLDPREGLMLLWKSRLEEDFEEEEPREFRVSPYATGTSYIYHDTSGAKPKWERAEQPRRTGGELVLPARIELTFEYQDEKIVTTLVLPAAASGVPVY